MRTKCQDSAARCQAPSAGCQVKAASALTPRTSQLGTRRAFSFLEIMVVVALLSVIVLGLMAMFNQTQRAFRLGMSQTDILESGRMATEMIGREFEQMTPCHYGTNTTIAPNFYAQVTNTFLQSLTGTVNTSRTNIMQDVFFLVRQNQTWTGIGYFVRPNLTGGVGPVGTLYRFETNNSVAQFEANPHGLFAGYLAVLNQTESNNISKVLDGVVQFRVRPFDLSGWVIPFNPSWWSAPPPPYLQLVQACVTNGSVVTVNRFSASGEVELYGFFSNSVPASVELELGILEQQILQSYQSIPILTVQSNFLAGQAGHVHLFRQRIPIRNVVPSVY